MLNCVLRGFGLRMHINEIIESERHIVSAVTSGIFPQVCAARRAANALTVSCVMPLHCVSLVLSRETDVVCAAPTGQRLGWPTELWQWR